MTGIVRLTDRPAMLTENECIVFDQLMAHKKAKRVALDLDLSLSAVEERIRSVREKFGAPDRATAVQLYAEQYADHRNPVPIFQGLDTGPFSPEELVRELDGGPAFTLRDSQSWGSWEHRHPFLEAFDERFGIVGRGLLILGCFVILCFALGSAFDLFETLNRIM